MPQVHPVLPANGDDAIVDPYNAALNLILGVLNGSIDADNLADGAVTQQKLSAAVQGSLLPTGSMIAYGGITPPTGFLLCDGSSLLRSAYSPLFAVLGTAYGSADGTHFNVPDLRGRIPVGNDAMGGTAANRIQKTSTLTTVISTNTATVASATGLAVGMTITNVNVPSGTTITLIAGTTLTMSNNATANGTTVAARFSLLGDGAALGGVGGTDTHKLITDQLAAHTHDTGIVGSGGSGTGAHEVLDNTANNNAHRITLATGGDQPHPNLQPSVVANFIIKT